MDDRCSKSVWDKSGWHTYQCNRKAKVFVDGIGYCTQHSPEKVVERKAEEKRKRKINDATSDIKWAHQRLGRLVADYFSRHGTIKITPTMNTEIGIIEEAKDNLKELRSS